MRRVFGDLRMWPHSTYRKTFGILGSKAAILTIVDGQLNWSFEGIIGSVGFPSGEWLPLGFRDLDESTHGGFQGLEDRC